MNILSGYNKFTILGPQMRSYFFTILFLCFAIFAESQNYNAKSNTLGNCGLTENTIWSNFTNQAGLAGINQFAIGIGTENKFALKELSTHSAVLALPVTGSVFGLNIAYTGFELYNENKVGTIGDVGTFSFFPGKNLGAYGDAGAVITNDENLSTKMRMFANHGSLVKHEHQIEGINSRLDGIQAAILSVKLKHLEKWTELRIGNSLIYKDIFNWQ